LIVGSVISSTVGRIIRAIDLEVQRMQNQTIWLQNAQKALENQLSKLKLDEISSWSQQQKELFSSSITRNCGTSKQLSLIIRALRDLTQKQIALVNSYNQAWALIKNDKHFTADELILYDQCVFRHIAGRCQ
jgi:hypothetical protein